MDVMEYIKANFGQSLNNKSLAAIFSYHPYYLGDLFRKHLGKTLHAYIDEVRLNHASELLLLTEKSIYEIAAACGYKNAEHFTRRFRGSYGMAPTEWRNRRRLV